MQTLIFQMSIFFFWKIILNHRQPINSHKLINEVFFYIDIYIEELTKAIVVALCLFFYSSKYIAMYFNHIQSKKSEKPGSNRD
jgi:hypothetical protein